MSELSPREALERMREDPAVIAVRVIVAADACPACLAVAGTYDLDDAPPLPVPDCSHPLGCRCYYEPVLAEVYP
ncbi:MAG: hypothetical protein GXO54_00990 [Chloroflexi bacterium]|nr:hypothetical protein [Chloroflexota bacterium]